MNIHYDPEADALSIVLSDADVADSDEVAPGIVLDFDTNGTVIAIEILDAGKYGRNVRDLHYRLLSTETAPPTGD